MDTVTFCNLALQVLGARTTVTAPELANQTSNEAIQFNLCYQQIRDELLRLAPWQCAKGESNLIYITSLPGTNENQSTPQGTVQFSPNQPNPAQTQWQRGLPLAPWTYEYAYPSDCLRALSIVPQFNSGVIGVPIYPTNVFTGYSSVWNGPPIKFDVGQDLFYPVTAAAVANGGSGYAVGDNLLCAFGPVSSPPIGAPARLQVTSVGAGGAITGIAIVPSVYGEDTPQTGAYFKVQPNPQAMGSTDGSGTGATFNLTYGPRGQQRVILTNQEWSTLTYVRQVTDFNIMDSQFLRAFYHVVGARLAVALSGDKSLANELIKLANGLIQEARATDGNEALTINDVNPDWLRARGVDYTNWNLGTGFGWDNLGLWPQYG